MKFHCPHCKKLVAVEAVKNKRGEMWLRCVQCHKRLSL